MNKPLVSILICCHNRGHLLPQTMESVFAQEYKPVEIVVLDDGSTDNTPELMASFGDRVRYYWQENQGVAAARTAACRLAKGEYIAFQDDDDLMPPKRIILLYEALCQHPKASFAMGDWACIDREGNFTGERSNFKIKLGAKDNETFLIEDGYKAVLWPLVSPVPHTTLFRKADGERIGWFDTRFFHSCEDTDFFARCGQLGPIEYVPEIVSYYRQISGSLCKNNVLVEYSKLLLFEKHLKTLTAERKDLQEQLKLRLLSALNRIEFLKSQGKDELTSICKDYMKRGLAQLDIKGRFSHMFFKSIKLPIRNMLVGDN